MRQDKAADGSPSPARLVEYYGTDVEVMAAVVLRQSDGWTVLSAGRVDHTELWVEFERPFPVLPDTLEG